MSSEAKPKQKITVTYRTVTPADVRRELAECENKYGVTSTEFLRKFETGEMHDHEFGHWEFLCVLAKKYGIPLR